MPDRYTGMPSEATAAAMRGASGAIESAWLPITSNGRSAHARAAAAAARLEPVEAGAETVRTAGRMGSALPANIFSTCRLR